MRLSYHDALLEQEDIELLQGNHWLNDAVIAFAMEYFTHDMFSELASNTLFLSPSIVQMISLLSDSSELALLLEGSGIHKDKSILMPLNDHDDSESSGGSHWSLLSYHHGQFQLFDSLPSKAMFVRANIVATRLKDSFGCGLATHTLLSAVSDCPRQSNGFDCGVYAIGFAMYLAENDFDNQEVCSKLECDHVSALRTKLLDIVISLANS